MKMRIELISQILSAGRLLILEVNKRFHREAGRQDGRAGGRADEGASGRTKDAISVMRLGILLADRCSCN